MKQFDNILIEAISDGLTTEAIHTLRDTFEEFKDKYPENEEEIYDINNQVVLISSRHQELEKRELIGMISAADAKQERASIAYAFLEIVREMQQYANFMAYANKTRVTPIKPSVPLSAFKEPQAQTNNVNNHEKLAAEANRYKKFTWIGGGLIGGFILLLIIGSLSDPKTDAANTQSAETAPIDVSESTGSDANSGVYRQQAIIGTWVGVSLEAYENTEEANQFVQDNYEAITSITYDFHADGSLDFYDGSNTISGRFSVSEDGTTLTDTYSDVEDVYAIDKLTAATLVLVINSPRVALKFRKK